MPFKKLIQAFVERHFEPHVLGSAKINQFQFKLKTHAFFAEFLLIVLKNYKDEQHQFHTKLRYKLYDQETRAQLDDSSVKCMTT